MSKTVALDLSDLQPADGFFELSTKPEKRFRLLPYTLRVQLWATKHFGKDKLQSAVTKQDIEVLSELAHHVLDAEGKKEFPSLESLQDAVLSYKDRKALVDAVLETIGLSQPVLKKLTEQLEAKEKEGNAPDPAENSTGEKSST